MPYFYHPSIFENIISASKDYTVEGLYQCIFLEAKSKSIACLLKVHKCHQIRRTLQTIGFQCQLGWSSSRISFKLYFGEIEK